MDALAHLRVVSGAFEDELGTADLQGRPTGLSWTVAELAAHLGEVHRWAANNARHGPRQDRRNVPALEMPPAQWYSTGRAVLLAALDELDPDQPCRTFSPTDKSVRFWHRRQLHEVLVHLWDLRSAADPAAPPPAEVGAEVHADGIDELFDVFVPRGSREPLTQALVLRATDCERQWVIQPDWSLGETGNTAATASIAARAGELLLFAWNRLTPGPTFTVAAPPELLQAFRLTRVRP